MSRYKAGYRLERRIQKVYTSYGWLATRFPMSGRKLYPADVIAVKRIGNQTHIHLLECKNASKNDQKKESIYIEAEQILNLLEIAKIHQALALIAYSFPHQHVRVLKADKLESSGKMFYIQPKDGTPIKKFLRSLIQ